MIFLSLFSSLVIAASSLDSQNINLNIKGASLESVLKLISSKTGMQLNTDGDFSKIINANFSGKTVEQALKQLSNENSFDYSIEGNSLVVSKATANGSKSKSSLSPRLLQVKFADAEEIASRLKTVLNEGQDTYVDKHLNSIVIMSSEADFKKAQKFVDFFDRLPQQIQIEAKIVETNDNFSRELGFQLGGATGADVGGELNVQTSPKVSTDPQFKAKYRMGIFNNRTLDLQLVAAESKGDAKVISRPKVVTINNTRALINSGLTLNVKTLSNTITSGASGSSSVSGGLEKVEAGLQLGVLPTIVDNSLIRLQVDVNNSEPTSTYSVDGIPGISTNSANTSIIIGSGNTAVIAGLIKNRESNSRTGVPFFSDIPVLGMLFRNDGKDKRNNELVIFITPKIVEMPTALTAKAY